MKYVVYYRVSTKGQGESGLGLEAQSSLVNHFLKTEDIAKTVVEVISAKVEPTERPVLRKAIEFAKQNGFGLAVAKVDRLSRVTEHALAVYNELDAMLYACDIPQQKFAPMDKFTLTIYMAIADRERELIGIRTKAALEEVKRQQKRGIVRYHDDGRVKNNIGSPQNLTDSSRAKAVEAIKAKASNNENNRRARGYANTLKDQGLSLSKIAERLNNEGFKSSMGKRFHRTTVSRLLKR